MFKKATHSLSTLLYPSLVSLICPNKMPYSNQRQQQDESIYNLIPKPQLVAAKEPRYESKFKETAKQELRERREGHATMGYAREPVPKADEFLKAHAKESSHQFPRPPAPHRGDTPEVESKSKKPLVPRHDEQPLLGLKTAKNFVSQNAVDAIMTVPRKPEKNVVDGRKGSKFSLEPSGMTPVYIKKKVRCGLVWGFCFSVTFFTTV